MTTLLVTNDDGVTSPALIPLVQSLNRIPSVTTVNTLVPRSERSWISKAISRFESVEVLERESAPGDPTIWTASGTPADCANLGIHTLFPMPPDLLVSGINIGLNHGMAFLLGSGTVGAASEGAIAGIPAVAFSIGNEGGHGALVERARTQASRSMWISAAQVAAEIVTRLLEVGFPPETDVLNVNFPHDVTLETPRVLSEIAWVGYDALFRHREGNFYGFDYGGLKERKPSRRVSDREVLAAGKVSITAIQFQRAQDIPADLREALRAE